MAIVSRYPNSPHYHIEGRGYRNKSEANKHQKLFVERAKAIDSVNRSMGFDGIIAVDKLYEIAEINIPDNFFKD